jgi:hypothetical protein
VSYRLKLDESAPAGLKRIAFEQADDAIHRLRQDDVHEAVHEARKDCKKIRALLRLARDAVGGEAYQRENAHWRDAAREVSTLRDAQVLVESFDELRAELAWDGARVTQLRQTLTRRRDALLADLEARDAIAGVVEALERGRERIAAWRIPACGFDALEGGLARVYRRGRKGCRKAKDDADTQTLHDWRKRASTSATTCACSSPPGRMS